jgi:Domain of unknown function DUF29
MPDDLYDRDILIWSEHQADLIRRLARGERVNDVDWDHVAEEIEDVGRSELHAVESYLALTIVDLLKVHGWPASSTAQHWGVEAMVFQQDAVRRFTPSMRQKIDLERLYAKAAEGLEHATFDGSSPRTFPLRCPFTLDQLMGENLTGLMRHLTDAASPV